MSENLKKGNDFEEHIKNYITEIIPFIPENGVWLWREIPEDTLYDIGFVGDWNEWLIEKKKFALHEKYDYEHNYFCDTGVDILVRIYNQETKKTKYPHPRRSDQSLSS